MDRWEELHREEREFLEKEDCFSKDKRQVERIKEAYDSHLKEAQHFMEENCYLFHKNDKRHIHESTKEVFSKESYQIMEHLEESNREIEVEKRKVQQKLDDIIYEKRKVAGQEEKNEH